MYPSPGNPDQPAPRHGGLWPPRSGPPSASVPLSAPLAANVLPAGASAPPAVPLAPVPPAQPLPGSAATPADGQRARIRDDVEGLRRRASVAGSWLETSAHSAQLINRAGVGPVTA